MEAHVLKPEYEALFSEEERRICRDMLEAYGYNDGAMVGMERGRQKGTEDAAERMAMSVMPDSGVLNYSKRH